jgi:hypothetical protein
MAVRLSALHTGRALLPETLFFCFWYSFLLEADITDGSKLRSGKVCWMIFRDMVSVEIFMKTSNLIEQFMWNRQKTRCYVDLSLLRK